MSGQEAVPTDARLIDLPAEEAQQPELVKEELELLDLSTHPGWRYVKQSFEERINKYRIPAFDPSMPPEEIGKQYLMSQTIATNLQEVLDVVESVVSIHNKDR